MQETTAEYEVAEIRPPAELKTRIRVTVAGKTDLGRTRENNEDKFEFFIAEEDAMLAGRGHIFVVCDGMGGHAAGQIASEVACKTFMDVYMNHPGDSAANAATAGVSAAHRFVTDIARVVPDRKGMGTTLSAVMLIQDRAVICQVGDSRVYRLRNGELSQVTTDHSWVEESVAAGMMSREEAEKHPYRNMLTRAIGAEEAPVTPDIIEERLEEGDLFLLCSDGLMAHVEDDQIRQVLEENAPSRASWKLVQAALAGGGSDNVTVLIARVDALESV